MTLSPRAIEVAVKAIGALRKARRAALPFMPYGTSKPIIDKDLAETAITAYLAAIAVDGVALVPKEPTQAMIIAGCENNPTQWNEDTDNGFAADVANYVYRAMLAAASDGDTPREDNKK